MCSCRAWRRWRSSYHLRFIAYVWHRAHSHPAGGKQWQGNLGFQRVDARQRLALHPFEERAARGRDKGEIVRYAGLVERSEEHTSELQSLMRISYAVFCLKKKKKQ